MQRPGGWRAILIGVALGACGAGLATLPEPTPLYLEVAQREEPAITLEDLSRGRTVYRQRCGGCHALKAPGDVAPEAWPGVVEQMREKQGVRLSEAEHSDLLRYLRAASAVARGAR